MTVKSYNGDIIDHNDNGTDYVDGHSRDTDHGHGLDDDHDDNHDNDNG